MKRYLPHERLGAVQTPQAFARERIEEAFAGTRRSDFTDDAGVVLRAGHEVAVVDGEATNMKITSPEELLDALRTLRRTGQLRG